MMYEKDSRKPLEIQLEMIPCSRSSFNITTDCNAYVGCTKYDVYQLLQLSSVEGCVSFLLQINVMQATQGFASPRDDTKFRMLGALFPLCVTAVTPLQFHHIIKKRIELSSRSNGL